MHLVRGLTSLNFKKRKAKVTKKHQKLLAEFNVNRVKDKLPQLTSLVAPRREKNAFKPMQFGEGIRRLGSLDYQKFESKHDTSYHATVTSIMDPMILQRENEETRAAIIAKSKCIAPAYSKGAYQLITPGMDPSDLGKKK